MKRIGLIGSIAAASYLLWQTFWPSPPELVDQTDVRDFSRDSTPIVVAGILASDTLVRGNVPRRSDPTYSLQLRRLTVQVENVLKGAPIAKNINVYYFTWAGGFDGPRPLGFWKIGGRRIFWLRRDRGVLRTACDGWDYCTWGIASGAHLGYKADPQRSINYALADLLLTRGEGALDEDSFARSIENGVPDAGLQDYVVAKLRHLAESERDDVKSSACKMLWIYTVDRVGPSIHAEANSALRAGNCQCAMKTDGNIECH